MKKKQLKSLMSVLSIIFGLGAIAFFFLSFIKLEVSGGSVGGGVSYLSGFNLAFGAGQTKTVANVAGFEKTIMADYEGDLLITALIALICIALAIIAKVFGFFASKKFINLVNAGAAVFFLAAIVLVAITLPIYASVNEIPEAAMEYYSTSWGVCLSSFCSLCGLATTVICFKK